MEPINVYIHNRYEAISTIVLMILFTCYMGLIFTLTQEISQSFNNGTMQNNTLKE